MIQKVIIVTNNPMSEKKLSENHKIDFIQGTTMDVLKKVRDYVHKGHKLLTHPLMSSIKPNETPYRTIVVSKIPEESLDMNSLSYIEEGIHTTEKFLNIYGIPKWNESILDDFQLIDFDLIYHALN